MYITHSTSFHSNGSHHHDPTLRRGCSEWKICQHEYKKTLIPPCIAFCFIFNFLLMGLLSHSDITLWHHTIAICSCMRRIQGVSAQSEHRAIANIFCLIIQIQFISDKWERVPKKVTTTSHKCHFSCHSTSTPSNVQYCHQHHVHCWLQAPNDRQLARCDFGGLEGAATPARTHRCPKLSNNPDWEDPGTQNCLLPPHWWLIKWRLTD